MVTEKVRAKFVCIEIRKVMGGTYDENGKYTSGILHAFRFVTVTSNSEENKKFFSSTPNGSIEIQSVRDDIFEIGKEYYIDFTLAVPLPKPMAIEE